jgi:hypothetical protein
MFSSPGMPPSTRPSGTGWKERNRFGGLAVNNLGPAQAPIMLPTNFTALGDELLIHLARPLRSGFMPKFGE